MKYIILIIILFSFISVAEANSSEDRCAIKAIEISGDYISISESEWSIEYKLSSDGGATIIQKKWSPGSVTKQDSKSYYGSWLQDGSVITLFFDDHSRLTTQYISNLSTLHYGEKGFRKALIPIDSSASKYHLLKILWRKNKSSNY